VGGFMALRYPSLAASNVTLIPSPREIDPPILAWKGVSVLNQLDVCAEMWVRADDFAALGMKALKDRMMCFN
jgi:actin-related protein 8